MKNEIKKEINVQDAYLEILNMGYDQNIDSNGIQKFILKYTDEVV